MYVLKLLILFYFVFSLNFLFAGENYFGMNIKGVITHFNAKGKKLIALTLDACSGRYDKDLIEFLIKNRVKATLFLSGRWLDKHPDIAKKLSNNPLFEIENHGLMHRPLTVAGESVYGIKGTTSHKEAYKEIKANEEKIYKLTGKRTRFFRSGTAHYDTEGIKIAHKLGYKIIGFNINGDYGATAKKEEIFKNITTKVSPGSIILCHMNHPEKETFEGLRKTILYLKKHGFKFVKLSEVIP